MTDEVIPSDIQQFILLHIDSIAQLEGLLMLRADPQKKWTAHAVAQALYIQELQASTLLMRLLQQGFLKAEESDAGLHYQYHSNTELHDMVEHLAGLYRQYLVPITNLIHSKSRTRIQEFANAFRIRKD
jgi:hypothetical protein